MFAKSDPEVLSDDFNSHLSKVMQENFAYFSDNSQSYDVLAANHCDVKYLSDVQMTSSFVFYLQKGSPYTKLVSDE